VLDNQDKPPFPFDAKPDYKVEADVGNPAKNASQDVASSSSKETEAIQALPLSEGSPPPAPESGLTTAAADAAIPDDNMAVSEEVPYPTKEASTVVPVRSGKSFWREVLETIILTILIFFVVKSLIQNFRIEGSSMEPNFHTRQMLLVNKAAYFHFELNTWLRIIPGVKAEGSNVVWLFGGPKRGDVLVLEPPDVPTEDYIKRLIGLPGDKVEVRDGIVYINDNPLKENYIKEKPFSNYGPVTIPANALFVMGDNRNASRDGRVFGFLPFDKVIGKAMFIYWPFGGQWGIVPPVEYS